MTFKEVLDKCKIIELNDFINNFKAIESYRLREAYLNQEIAREIKGIILSEDYIKLDHYVNPSALYLKEKLNLNNDWIDTLKTLVYCYNSNEREINKDEREEHIKKELLNRGFNEQTLFKDNQVLDLKFLDGKKVICVVDISKIGLLGSFDKKEEIMGTLKYSNYNNALMLIPKRCRSKGYIIRKKFYYKEI